MNTDESLEELRAEFDAAFSARSYAEAFRLYLFSLYRRAHYLVVREGLKFEASKKPEKFTDALLGMAQALNEHIKSAGDTASYKLEVAADVMVSTARIMLLMERAEDPEQDHADVVAELVLQSVMLGTAEVTLAQTMGGFLDEYGELKWKEHKRREQRSKGGSSTTAAKRRRRGSLLSVAQGIVSANPSLSNSEIAFKLKTRANLPEQSRTVEGWIRAWRRSGQLEPAAARDAATEPLR